jgi:hypothetical protein
MDSLDYNQRQYHLMEEYLHHFEQGELALHHLIKSLEGLLEALQNPDLTWKETFRSEWWTLEQVYAVACDRKEPNLSPESETLINEAISNMKSLLKSPLTRGGTSPHP